MLGKLSLRDIRSSLGRFLAIAAIIALGVGLFAGLRVSKDAMILTGDQYLRDFQLHDFRLLSTLGFTDGDVEAFGVLPGVRTARGSRSREALFETKSGSDGVIVMLTLLPDLNVPDLRAGRLPESTEECALDASYFGEDVIGTQLTLSLHNDEDTLDFFASRSYTVVGLVDSPLYINFERGSTSLGSGKVDCFGYLLPEDFTAEYYTELYLTLDDTALIYSEAYAALADQYQPAVENLLESRADLRYETLRGDAQQELDKARTELDDSWAELEDARLDYADGTAEAETELSDALITLQDARAELDGGWAELDDARAALARETASAQAELQDGQKELDDALFGLQDGQKELDDALAELEDGEIQYADGLRDYQEGLAAFEDGKVRYEQGQSDYDQGLQEYEDGLAKYQSGLSAYRSGRAAYNEGWRQYQDGMAQMEAAMELAGIEDMEAFRAAITVQSAQVEGARTLLNTLAAQLQFESAEALFAALDADEDGMLAGMLAGVLAQLPPELGAPADADALRAIYDQIQQYDQAVALIAGYDELQAAKEQLDSAASQLSSASSRLSDAKRELDEAKEQLNKAKAELADAETALTDGWAELEDARIELEDARAGLDDGWASYRDGQAELADGQAEYEDGVRRLADGRRELAEKVAEAEAEIAEAKAKLTDGERAYQDALAEYEDAQKEADETLRNAAREIEDGQQELEDGEAEYADGLQELEKLEPAVCYTLGRSANIGYVCFESDTNIVASVAGVFPLFFFLVAALVCTTTMTRMVEDERTRIGVLKALGYGNGAIVGKYLFYSGAASLLGCAVGLVGGSWLFPTVMWKVYDIMYSFSYPIRFVLDWRLAAFSIGLYLLCSLGSTLLVCRVSLRTAAADLIRPKAPKNGKRILLERVTFLWRRLPFLHKVSARSIFRYKKRLFMMVLGIGGCTALLLTGFGIRDSIANVVDFQFSEISFYDSSVTFLEPMGPVEQQAFLDDCGAWVERAVFFHGSSVDVSSGRRTKSVNLVVAGPEITEYMDFHQGSQPLPYPDGGALINNGLAEAMELRAGDLLTIRDGEMHTMTVPVSGIYDNYIFNYVFVTPETAEAQWGFAPEVKSAYIVDRADADHRAAGAALIGHEDVASATINVDLQARVGAMLSSLDYVVLLVILCAGGLAFIVLYNLTNININERIREIATIKVLGFYAGETASYVFRENFVLTIVGAVLGLGLGRLLHAYVMLQIRIDTMHFDAHVAGWSYLWSFALTFVFAAAVDFIFFFRLERIHMAESLKSTE
ncbi:MAG: FtsX-like permease family protein [Oscillospiraceae bacterium]|nr:FtsX-like permease family protein [Oscillospiraceae bacterium]